MRPVFTVVSKESFTTVYIVLDILSVTNCDVCTALSSYVYIQHSLNFVRYNYVDIVTFLSVQTAKNKANQ